MTTTAPTTTTPPDPALTVTEEISDAAKIALTAIAVLAPGAGEWLVLLGAIVAVAPLAEPEIASIVDLLRGTKAAPPSPLEPQIAADTQALDDALHTPIAPPAAAKGA